jgi:hypothetical protein
MLMVIDGFFAKKLFFCLIWTMRSGCSVCTRFWIGILFSWSGSVRSVESADALFLAASIDLGSIYSVGSIAFV